MISLDSNYVIFTACSSIHARVQSGDVEPPPVPGANFIVTMVFLGAVRVIPPMVPPYGYVCGAFYPPRSIILMVGRVFSDYPSN